VWAVQQFIGLQSEAMRGKELMKATIIGALLGLALAGVIGFLDALLNSGGAARYVRVGICVIVGFFGSMFGAMVGQFLFEKTDKLPFLVFGWTLVGVIIGASLGVFDLLRALRANEGMRQALRKVINGIIGGAVGGVIGGAINAAMYIIPWIPMEATPENPIVPDTFKAAMPKFFLATGLVILGMCIGLLIGLAQIILKEAWVKVEAGFKAGREMILSKPDTTVGRAESCDIGLFGDNQVEKLHARIVMRGDRYMLVDVNTPGGTFLNGERITGPAPLKSGDMIGLGKSVLRFEERAKRK
jgi:hypothetical protein